MLQQIIGHLLAACIGLSLGLIGGGGSVLALPILVYVMEIDPKPAIAMTLVIVGIVSLVGTIPHWKRHNVNIKKAFMFGSATMLGAFLGAKLASLPFITGAFQMLLFAFMMMLAAIFMIKKSGKQKQEISPTETDLSLYPQPICKYCWLWMLTEGLGIGILTGLVGVGGGFAIVPALVLLGNTPIKEAIGTSLVIISLNSLSGFLGYLGQVEFNVHLMLSFTIVAGFGILLGGHLSQFVKAKDLQKGFGYFLIAVSAFILFQQRNDFQPSQSQQNNNNNPISKVKFSKN